MPSPYISIIIVNYNGRKYILDCVSSVLSSDYNNFELIIIDNGSTDNSIDLLASIPDSRVVIVYSDRNLGFADGNNLGSKRAKGDYIVLLNVDTKVDPRWLNELISVMEMDSSIGIAQPKILSLDNSSVFDSAGDYIDYFGFSFRRGGEWHEKDTGQYDMVHDIFSARGAALVTRREIIDKVGLFDSDYFLDFEDIDFCWRVRLYGKRVVFVPKSIVYHKAGGISSYNPMIKNIHPSKNIMMTMIKNYDTKNVFCYGIVPHVLSFITGFFIVEQFLMKRKHKLLQIEYRIKSYLWIFANARRIRNKRIHVQNKIRKVPDSIIMRYMIRTSFLDVCKYLLNIKKFGRKEAARVYFGKLEEH